MRIIAPIVISALLGACQPKLISGPGEEEKVVEAADNGELDFTASVDVTDDGIFFVGSEQTPDSANPAQPLVWRCYGDGFPGGWQGEGCFTALPISHDGEHQGFGQVLPPDGTFRLSCADPDATADPDDQGWCRHLVGVDSEQENDWLIGFEECGRQKANLCIQMIEGQAYSGAEAECLALYVPPTTCM